MDSASVRDAASAKQDPKLILNPTTFAQLLLLRSLEIEYSRYSKDVAYQMAQAEAALYETVKYFEHERVVVRFQLWIRCQGTWRCKG
jgi:hypothetical protein